MTPRDTRAEMVKDLRLAAELPSSIEDWDDRQLVIAAAAELAKDCLGCKHFYRFAWTPFSGRDMAVCQLERVRREVPADGSGYCRPGWSPK